MKTASDAGKAGHESQEPPSDSQLKGNVTAPIADYYDDTLIDYDAWSREGYLHFGYWRPWLNPFRRRPMLEEMNRLIYRHLHLDNLSTGSVGDFGCGVGAVSRFGSQQYPQLDFHAVTISPGQVAEAQRRHSDQRVAYYCADYHTLPLESASLDGAFYLESLCHSTRPEAALAEAARVLRPGARLVLTDGFLTRPLDRTSPLFRYVVKAVAHNWAVPMFHQIQLAKQWTGGGNLKLVDEFECGWRLGPSALHAAHLSLVHFIKLSLTSKSTPWQWRHLTASAFTIALGLYRRHFRYHLLAFERL
ncbi:MAG: class I SAM-dependent methyltransferase [Pirellulaceae bacterium]